MDGPGDKWQVSQSTRGADLVLNFLLAYDVPAMAIARRPPHSGFIVDGFAQDVLCMDSPPWGALTMIYPPPREVIGGSSALDWMNWCAPTSDPRELFCRAKYETDDLTHANKPGRYILAVEISKEG